MSPATAVFPLGTRMVIVWNEADNIINELAIRQETHLLSAAPQRND